MLNDLTKMLGIEYPIIQGGMFGISGSKLVAAVSNAGGLGTLAQYMDLGQWQEQIKKTKETTSKPFAVNLPMHAMEIEKKVKIIIDENIPIVVTAAGNPTKVLGPLKEAGIKIMHVVANVTQARKVESAGVDAIIAEGGESGGMVAKDRVSTMVLTPAVVDAVKVPVVAAGGIADTRGLVAALALGAQGVQLGTRFIVTPECDAPNEWREGIIRARETDTQVVPRGKAQGRGLKDEVQAGVMAGIVSGIIDEVETVREIIDKMVDGSQPILDKVGAQIKAT